MRRVAVRIWKGARSRPRTLAALGALLAAGGFAGGWIGATHATAEKVAYTSSPANLLRRPAPPPAPAALQSELEAMAARYREPVGIAVTDVTDGWTAEVNGAQRFPQQSVSKLWVAMSVLQAVDDGRLALDQQVVMGPGDRSVFYQPLARRIRGPNGFAITIAELMRHALIESDNAANDKLMAEVGGAGAVTQAIARKGLRGLAVGASVRNLQCRTAGLTWRPEYGLGWTFKAARAQLPDAVRDAALAQYLADPPDGATPAGITTALAALKRGELLSRASTDFMLGLMGEATTGRARLRGGLTPGWSLAHKTGTGPDWRGASVGINDVGLLTAPDGRTYAVAVMMRETSQPLRARQAFMQKLTRTVAAFWASADELPAQGRQVAAAQAGTANGL